MESVTPIKLADTHCHLNFDIFKPDLDLVLQRARNYGVSRILIPGIDIETSKSAIQYASDYQEIFVAVGIHPNQISDRKGITIPEIKNLLKNKKVVAIGEIGLDYYRDFTPRNQQIPVFEAQMELAGEAGLPVVIHNRDASEDILKIIQKWHAELIIKGSKLADNPGVMHSFSGDLKFAREMVALHFKIGITGLITYKKSETMQAVVNNIPTDSLLIETDAPFLSPHPYRGKRNEPANVRIVAEEIAKIKGISLESIAKTTTAEAEKLFNWREVN